MRIESVCSKNAHFDSIEILRGVASLLVALCHISGILSTMGPIEPLLQIIMDYGVLRVDIFFVISGFIITHSLIVNQYQWRLFPKFILKRIIRIEPPYLISILFVLLLSFMVTLSPLYRGVPFEVNVKQLLFHVAYLPIHFGYKWINPVYWSLEVEFYFYLFIGLFYPILFYNKISIIVFLLLGGILAHFVAFNVFHCSVLFAFGIACAAFKHQYLNLLELYKLIFVIFMMASILHLAPIKLTVGALTAYLILQQIEWGAMSIMRFLGRISYSLYLVHMPLAIKTIRLLKHVWHDYMNNYTVLLVTLFVCIIVSYLFYLFIELPAKRWSKRIKLS